LAESAIAARLDDVLVLRDLVEQLADADLPKDFGRARASRDGGSLAAPTISGSTPWRGAVSALERRDAVLQAHCSRGADSAALIEEPPNPEP
jgi:hypothetical protein